MFLPETLEHNGQRILTTAQLAEAYGTTTTTITTNFSRNKERYQEGKHFYCLIGEELKKFKHDLTNCNVAANLNKLYLWTEYGALLHAKSLNTDKAWEVYSFLVENYFNPVRRIQKPTSQLDILSGMIEVMKQQEERLKAVEDKQNEQEEQLDKVRDAYEITSYNWRTEASKTVAKIARATNIPISRVWLETYNALETKAHCTLKTRRENKKQRMLENGCTPTQAKTVCNLDVIAEDTKLREIYIGILRDMRFKAGV